MSPQRKYSQDELITLIASRDQDAFAYLYDNYSQALMGVINTILNDTEESEDVLQKVFLKIWSNFDSFDAGKGRLYTWMLNIARNAAIDATRSRHLKFKSKIRNSTDNVNEMDSRFQVSDTAHENIGLKSILNQLADESKKLIQLAYFEGYTQEEISKKLSVPLGTIKTRIRQALIQLRKLTKNETR